jgi:ribosome biogenesis GTPase
MPEGIIVKALSGYYFVQPADGGEVLRCRARGVFKLRGVSPLVGDRVRFEATGGGEGTVREILPRTTELIRPPVANVDLAVLVFSVVRPELNLALLDKFLVHVEHKRLDALIVFTKVDAVGQASDPDRVCRQLEDTCRLYGAIGYPYVRTSAQQGVGLDELRARLAGRIAVFAGQSGVGKSTLLNALMPGLALDTGEISEKLGRGRHTTRHVELIRLPGGGLVADTPGFSQLDFRELGVDEIGECFREFRPLAAECRFRGCTHLSEPGCAVHAAVESGAVADSRYRHYAEFLAEWKEHRRRY